MSDRANGPAAIPDVLLQVDHATRLYGGVAAVNDVSFEVRQGEILGLIGPNGSGKTTVLNMLSGFLPADAGQVSMQDRDITSMRPDKLAQQGVLRMFQMTRVFTRTSALDNLLTAGMARGLAESEAMQRARSLVEELTLGPVQHLDA